MTKTLLRQYAKLVVNVGAHVQRGQGVVINTSVDQSEFATLVAKEAYRAGAKWVHIQWSCQDFTKVKYKNESVTQLSKVTKWEEERMQYMVDTLPASIHIMSDDPDGLKGLNPMKLQKSMAARGMKMKKYRDAMDNKFQWTIVAVPSEKWAKKVFPGERTSVAVSKLWDAILKTVRVSADSDPVAAWDAHNAFLKEKFDKMNSYHFEKMHYYSENGTDFTCQLIPQALWMGGGEALPNGVYYNPNMPTEEVFTSPLKGACEGTLVATMPLSYQGNLIDKFSVTFKDGKAVSCKAEQGQELLESILKVDEGAAMLGELALVPCDSPIYESGILYYNTLFDENAACHVALGHGFDNVIADYEKYSKDELKAMGVNDSMIHVDFMIGCNTLQIDGITADGKTVPVFRDGLWAL